MHIFSRQKLSMDARHHIKHCHSQQPHTGSKLYSRSRIMLLALLFSCALWVADAFINLLFFREETFSAALFLKVLLQDVYTRLLILGCFCVFGVIVSSMASKQRRIQERLETSEHLLTNVFESIKDGISILGPDLTILRVTKSCENGMKKRCCRWRGQRVTHPIIGLTDPVTRAQRCAVLCPAVLNTTPSLACPVPLSNGWKSPATR
jgi:PAS domain-containing protein